MCESFKLCIHPTFPPLFFSVEYYYIKKRAYIFRLHIGSPNQPSIQPSHLGVSKKNTNAIVVVIVIVIHIFIVDIVSVWYQPKDICVEYSIPQLGLFRTLYDRRTLSPCMFEICMLGFFYSFYSFLGFGGGLPFSSL